MNGNELECAIRSNSCIQMQVKGVFARNNLPTGKIHYPSAYIVNNHTSDLPGEHWMAIVLESKSHGVFFDSFGKPPEFYGEELKHFLNCYVKQYECFNVQVQPKSSSHCGLFVLTFLMLNLCFKYSLNSIVNIFDSNVYANDHFVFNFVNTYYSLCQQNIYACVHRVKLSVLCQMLSYLIRTSR